MLIPIRILLHKNGIVNIVKSEERGRERKKRKPQSWEVLICNELPEQILCVQCQHNDQEQEGVHWGWRRMNGRRLNGIRRGQENHQTLMIVIMIIMNWWDSHHGKGRERVEERIYLLWSRRPTVDTLSLSLSPSSSSSIQNRFGFPVKRIDNGSKLCHSYPWNQHLFSHIQDYPNALSREQSKRRREREDGILNMNRSVNGKGKFTVSVLNYNLSMNSILSIEKKYNLNGIFFSINGKKATMSCVSFSPLVFLQQMVVINL